MGRRIGLVRRRRRKGLVQRRRRRRRRRRRIHLRQASVAIRQDGTQIITTLSDQTVIGTQILTASCDLTIRLWDAENGKCTGTLMGHTGSVKTLSTHPSNNDILVSDSRDVSFALWDIRCDSSSRNSRGETRFLPPAVVKEAHPNFREKRRRRNKSTSMRITSVLYLKDEITNATASAVGRYCF